MSPQAQDLRGDRIKDLEQLRDRSIADARLAFDRVRTITDELAGARHTADDFRDIAMRAIQASYSRDWRAVASELIPGLLALLERHRSVEGRCACATVSACAGSVP